MVRKKKNEENIMNEDFQLGIKIFEDENLRLQWFATFIEAIKNSYLVTLKYIPEGSKVWYQDVYSLKSKEEIETFVFEVTKHLI